MGALSGLKFKVVAKRSMLRFQKHIANDEG